MTRPALAKASGVDADDLIQAGLIGLHRALEKFEPERGTAFSTYASHWIHHGIRRTLSNHSRTIRVPVWRFDQGHAGVPTVSLSTPVGDDSATLEDLIAAPQPTPTASTNQSSAGGSSPHLAVLAAVEPRLARVVRARLAGRTLTDIGCELGVTRERVRQLEAQAIGVLRRTLAKWRAA